jgi:hypothetical protein
LKRQFKGEDLTMRTLKNLVLAGAALGALALAGGAFAKDAPHTPAQNTPAQNTSMQATHVMTLALPDGAFATIHYQGAKPDVTITPGALTPAWAADPLSARLWHWSFADPLFGAPDIFADMDRQMAAMTRDMRAFDATGGSSLISSSPGAHYCAESMEMTQTPGQPAHVERHVYGDCATETGSAHNGAAHSAQSQSHTASHEGLRT